MQANSASEIFDTLVPKLLAENTEKTKALGGVVFLFRVGENEWTCDLRTTPGTCKKEKSKNPNCTIEMSEKDLLLMLKDPNAAMNLFFSGRLKISGDVVLATRIGTLFQ